MNELELRTAQAFRLVKQDISHLREQVAVLTKKVEKLSEESQKQKISQVKLTEKVKSVKAKKVVKKATKKRK